MSCCYFFKLRWVVATVAILMFALYASSPWLPYESLLLSDEIIWKFPNPDTKDYLISFFGAMMCAILFFGAIFENLSLIYIGFIGHYATIMAVLTLLGTSGETWISCFDVKKYPALVSLNIVVQFFYQCVTGVYWYNIMMEGRSIIKSHLVPSS